MNCRVVRTGDAVTVFDNFGQPSKLYEQALERTSNTDEALSIWAVTQTENWVEMFGENKETNLEEVLRYLSSMDNQSTLDKDELQEVQMIMKDLGLDSVFAFTNKMNSLFQPNGYFEIDSNRLLDSGLYTQDDIDNLNEVNVKNLISKLNTYNLDFEVLNNNDRILPIKANFKDTRAERTIFGTKPVVNEQDIIKIVADQAKGDFSKKSIIKALADTEFSSLIDSKSVVSSIVEYLADKKLITNQFFNGTEYTSDNLTTYTTVKNTLLENVDTVELEESLDFVKSLDVEIWDNNKETVKQLLKELTEDLAKSNIDVVGIENVIGDKQAIEDLLEATQTMLENPSEENVITFSQIKDSLIKPDSNTTLEQVNSRFDGLNVVRVNSEFTDSELFENSGLIKIDNTGLYHKVSRATKEELYDAVYEGYVNNTINIDPKYFETEFPKDLENQASTREGIRTFIQSRDIGFNSPLAEEISLNQVAFGHPNLKADELIAQPSENADYLKQGFVSDFYNYQIREKIANSPLYNKVLKYFSITDNDITLNNLNVRIGDTKYETELREYANIKKNGLIKNLAEFDNNVDEDLKALNNPKSVNTAQGVSLIKDGDYLVTSPNADLYTKVGDKVYRKLLDSLEGTIYGEVRIEPDNIYFDTNTNFSFNEAEARAVLNRNTKNIEPKLAEESKELKDKIHVENVIKSTTENTGQFSNENNDIRFQIISEKGASQVLEYKESLDEAKKMHTQGVPLSEIENKTKWYLFKDSWRRVSPEAIRDFKIKDSAINKVLTLKDVLGNENVLFNFYPQLRETKVVFADTNLQNVPVQTPKDFEKSNGLFHEDSNTIIINTRNAKTQSQQEYTLSHEVVHNVQKLEGLPKGGGLTSVLFETLDILNLEGNKPLPQIYQEIISADKSKLTINEKKIVQASIDTVSDLVLGRVGNLQSQYLHLMGEIDANIVEGAMNIRDNYGFIETSYSSLLNFYNESTNIDPDNILLLKNGNVRFNINESNKNAPKETVKEVINKLKEIGLAEKVFELTSAEMEAKLVELGIENVAQNPNGFTYKNEVYLNTDLMTEDLPIHEFNHLYTKWLKENNKATYDKGISLITEELNKENSEIKDVIDFVKTNQQNLKGEKLKEEILTELIGRKGVEIIEENKNTAITNWLKNVWSKIKGMLGLSQFSAIQVSKMNLGEYSRAMAVDLLSGNLFEGKNGEANYQRWKGENKEVSGEEVHKVKTGEPIVAKGYHGTTNEFYEFDASVKGNIEGHLGKVNYFTSDYQDASQNYLAEGADITGRIDRRQDEIESELFEYFNRDEEALNFQQIIEDFSITDEEVENLYPSGQPEFIQAEEISRFLAEKELKGTEEKVLELYVKLNNPVVLGNGATWFETLDIDEVYMQEATEEIAEEYGITEDEAKEEYEYEIRDRAVEKQGDGNKIVSALEQALDDNGYDQAQVFDILGDNYYETEVDLNKLEESIRNSKLYENYNGEYASSQVIADFFKNLGFDGIILTDVAQRFRNMGLSDSTSHIHVFDEFNNQIKLSDGTNSTFGETKDIRFQNSENKAVISQQTINAKVNTYQSANDIGLEIVNLYPQSKSEDIQREFNECAI